VSDIFFDVWGSGTPVVLVHGSLATGVDEWQAQRPLAEQGFRLLVPDRRGYGRSPSAPGEDYLRDAEDIAGLMGEVPTSWGIRTAGSPSYSPRPGALTRHSR
jgi:pimeloyl-ACP methyl ester carboxylesterase